MNHPNEDFIAVIFAKDTIQYINFDPENEGDNSCSVMKLKLKSGEELKYLVRKEWIEDILNQFKTEQFIEIKIDVRLKSNKK